MTDIYSSPYQPFEEDAQSPIDALVLDVCNSVIMDALPMERPFTVCFPPRLHFIQAARMACLPLVAMFYYNTQCFSHLAYHALNEQNVYAALRAEFQALCQWHGGMLARADAAARNDFLSALMDMMKLLLAGQQLPDRFYIMLRYIFTFSA